MRMREFLLILLLGLATPALCGAQESGDRARAEIERTEQRVERARALVAGVPDATAQAEVARAIELQAGARSAHRQGRPRVALDLTLRARAAADRALAAINGLPDPDRVASQLDLTRELLERSSARIAGCDQGRGRGWFAAAGDMQRRAEAAARVGNHLAALQLTLGARDRAERALRQCNAVDDSRDGTERALRRTEEMIGRARDRLGANPPDRARRLLERAVEVQAQAQRELRDRHADAAVTLTLSARAFALRAERGPGIRR